ncbi:TonB family protein [Pararhodobacter oceanensis]|uniref:energy transducer TonB family protein n=1 Tax=Pararhodobacter oceanensis TaxID=2172121 RepID=UPI003A951C11
MSEALRFTLCLAAAGAVHLAVLPSGERGAAGSAGAGGDAMVSLLASEGALGELIEDWQRAPVVNAPESPAEPVEITDVLPPVAQPNQPVALAVPRVPTMSISQPETAFVAPISPENLVVNTTPPTAAHRAPSLPDALAPSAPTAVPTPPLALAMPMPTPAPETAETRFTAPPPPPPPAPEPPAEPAAEPRPFVPAPPERPADLMRDVTPPAEPPATAPAAASPPPAAAPATAARRAQGSGGGESAGAQGQSADPGGAARQADALATWGARIRAQIERHRGRTAGRGRVTLRLRIQPNGALVSASVVQGSGNARLDTAALSAAQSARFPAADPVLGTAARTFQISLRFGR